MTLSDFNTLYYTWHYKDSTVPKHAQPRTPFKEGSANELTRTIIAFFKMKGIEAWRQASEGRFIKGREYTDWKGMKKEEKGMYIPRSKKAKGSADISVTIPPLGRRLEVEVKYGKDRQSDDQKDFQKRIEAMGGIYMIAKTWDDFYGQITKYVK